MKILAPFFSKPAHNDIDLEFLKKILFNNLSYENNGKLYELCKCGNFFHKNCFFLYLFKTGMMQCKQCLELYRIKSLENLRYRDLFLRYCFMKNIIFYLICIICSIGIIIYIDCYSFSEKFLHLRCLFFVLFYFLCILNFGFLIYDCIVISRKIIPKTLTVDYKDENAEEIEHQEAPLNNPDKSNQYLLTPGNLPYLINNYLNKIKDSENKNLQPVNFKNLNLSNFIDNNKLNGSDKKSFPDNNNSLNKREHDKNNKSQFTPVKQNTIKIIIESNKTESIKNFLSYNKFYLNRDEKELMELRKKFNEKEVLRKTKYDKDQFTIMQLNNIEFQRNILLRVGESFTRSEENYSDEIRSARISKIKKRKNSIGNIIDSYDVEYKNNKNNNDALNEKSNREYVAYKLNIQFVSSKLSENDIKSVKKNNEDQIVINEKTQADEISDEIPNEELNAFKENKIPHNFSDNKIEEKDTELKINNLTKSKLITKYKISSSNLEQKGDQISANIESNLITKHKRSLRKNTNRALVQDFNEPINYHEFIVNESKPINHKHPIRNHTLRNINIRNNYMNIFSNNLNLENKKNPFQRRNSRIPNLFEDSVTDLNKIVSIEAANEKLFTKKTSFNSPRKNFIKSSCSLNYSDMKNNLLFINNQNKILLTPNEIFVKGIDNNINNSINAYNIKIFENPNLKRLFQSENSKINTFDNMDTNVITSENLSQFSINSYKIKSGINLNVIKSKFIKTNSSELKENEFEIRSKNKNFLTQILSKNERKLNFEIQNDLCDTEKRKTDQDFKSESIFPNNQNCKIGIINDPQSESKETKYPEKVQRRISKPRQSTIQIPNDLRNMETILSGNILTDDENQSQDKIHFMLENNISKNLENNQKPENEAKKLDTIISNERNSNGDYSRESDINSIELTYLRDIGFRKKVAQMLISTDPNDSSADDSEDGNE